MLPLPINRRVAPVEVLERLRSQRALPLALLLLALATPFVFVIDHGHFYRPGHHDWLSSKFLALAENMAPRWNFTGFAYLEPDQEGNPVPRHLYNRFPIGGYLLIKLATLPFGDDLSAKIVAARALMLTCFAAAAALAHLALARTFASRWIACAATALAFSSYYCLYYSDMISTEVAVDLFAVMLTLHGMAVFVQEGRFRQLLAKTCIALALGWHVYALLLPFIAFSMASDLILASRAACSGLRNKIKRFLTALFFGRPFALGVTAFTFGALVLSANLLGEYHMLEGAKPVTELPTWRSIIKRVGQERWFSAMHAEVLSWPLFLESQFQGLGRMILPYALPGYGSLPLGHRTDWEPWMSGLFLIGVAALAVCLAWLCFSRQRILLAALTLSGFFWSLPMRHSVAFHDFESVFYIGVPLTLFSLILLHIRKLSGERLMARIAVAALLVLVFSSWQMNRSGQDAAGRAFHAEVMEDFQAIRGGTEDGAIGVLLMGEQTRAVGASGALEYYLAQRPFLPLQHPPTSKLELGRLEVVDFIVTNWRKPGVDTLTPQNRRFFLYRRDTYPSRHDALLGDPLAQGEFDVYQEGNTLIYLKSPCKKADVTRQFGLHVWPVDGADLPEHRRQFGFDHLDFAFIDQGVREAGTCTAWARLPTYDIAKVATGQPDAGGPTWWVEFSPAR